jgi:hypothetical protein
MANELHYVPLPSAVTKLVEKTWTAQIKTAKGTPITQGL